MKTYEFLKNNLIVASISIDADEVLEVDEVPEGEAFIIKDLTSVPARVTIKPLPGDMSLSHFRVVLTQGDIDDPAQVDYSQDTIIYEQEGLVADVSSAIQGAVIDVKEPLTPFVIPDGWDYRQQYKIKGIPYAKCLVLWGYDGHAVNAEVMVEY